MQRSTSSSDSRSHLSQYSQFSTQLPISQPRSTPGSSYYEVRGGTFSSTEPPRHLESRGSSLIDGPDDRPLIWSSGHENVRNVAMTRGSTSTLSYSQHITRSASGSQDMSALSDERSYDSIASHSTHQSGHLSSQPSSENLSSQLRDSLARSNYRPQYPGGGVTSGGGGYRYTPPADDR
jgi:hypothetical protein